MAFLFAFWAGKRFFSYISLISIYDFLGFSVYYFQAEFLGSSMKILQYPLTILPFIGLFTDVYVFYLIFQHSIDDSSQLMSAGMNSDCAAVNGFHSPEVSTERAFTEL